MSCPSLADHVVVRVARAPAYISGQAGALDTDRDMMMMMILLFPPVPPSGGEASQRALWRAEPRELYLYLATCITEYATLAFSIFKPFSRVRKLRCLGLPLHPFVCGLQCVRLVGASRQ